MWSLSNNTNYSTLYTCNHRTITYVLLYFIAICGKHEISRKLYLVSEIYLILIRSIRAPVNNLAFSNIGYFTSSNRIFATLISFHTPANVRVFFLSFRNIQKFTSKQYVFYQLKIFSSKHSYLAFNSSMKYSVYNQPP